MGRFLNPQKVVPQPLLSPQQLPNRTPSARQPLTPAIGKPSAARRFLADQNPVVIAGFWLLILYYLSFYLSEVTQRYSAKSYLFMATYCLLPCFWLLTGQPFRALRTPAGKFWLLFLCCVTVSIPFSIWRGGSFALFYNYLPKNYLLLFYIPAFALTVRHCRTIAVANVFFGILLILLCVKYGEDLNGRFHLYDSAYFGNSNEVALYLILAGISFLFLFFIPPPLRNRIIAGLCIAPAIYFTLKTGSRGGLLSIAMLLIVSFFLSRDRLKMILFLLPIFLGASLLVSKETLRRLTYIVFKMDEAAVPLSKGDASSLASQMEREKLLKQSIRMTLSHPLVGVGPGMFALAAADEAKAKGVWSPWLGTHNSYTEVSSECGIPALICYVTVIFSCILMNYRLYQRSVDNPALRELTGLSLTCLFSLIVYAFSTIFFHISYSAILPTLAGFSIAIHNAAQPVLAKHAKPIPRSAGK
jgi:O-antigen ligase